MLEGHEVDPETHIKDTHTKEVNVSRNALCGARIEANVPKHLLKHKQHNVLGTTHLPFVLKLHNLITKRLMQENNKLASL